MPRPRSPRSWVLLVAVLMLAAVPTAAWTYENVRGERIAHGVTVAGIDVGGLTPDAAYLLLQRRVAAPLAHGVTIVDGNRSFALSAQDANVAVDTQAMVREALAAGANGNFLSRAARDIFGGTVQRNVRELVSYSHAAVRDTVARIAAAIDQQARDAAVVPSAIGLSETAEKDGLLVDAKRLGARIEHALTRPAGPHQISVPTHVAHPTVTLAQLSSRYPAYIVVDRAAFRLRLFENLKPTASYPIAVGRQGLETPTGLYSVQWKETNPSWHVPNSAWAGKLAGQVIPPGPQDPIKARWMAFDGGAGIHGIDPSEYSSIGHNASHGCVRMRIPDVIALYAKTPVGTPVYVA